MWGELLEGAGRVLPASLSLSADAQQQEGMTVVSVLSPVLLVDNGPWRLKCLQPSQGRCWGYVEEQGGAAEPPLNWEKGG